MRAPRLLPSLLVIACAALQAACSTAVLMPSGRWVDLSWEASSETLQLAPDTVLHTGSSHAHSDQRACPTAHGGTSIDAPLHFGEGRRSVDQVPVEQLIGPAVVVDVSSRALADRDYQVTVQDLAAWELDFGRMPHGAIVLLHTGYGQFWPDPVKYLGNAKTGPEGATELHFPGLHPTAAQWLANRRVGAVGIDTASIDSGQSRFFDSHRVLAQREIPTLENVARLERLPPDGAWIVALPLKLKGSSGGPVRIVALVR